MAQERIAAPSTLSTSAFHVVARDRCRGRRRRACDNRRICRFRHAMSSSRQSRGCARSIAPSATSTATPKNPRVAASRPACAGRGPAADPRTVAVRLSAGRPAAARGILREPATTRCRAGRAARCSFPSCTSWWAIRCARDGQRYNAASRAAGRQSCGAPTASTSCRTTRCSTRSAISRRTTGRCVFEVERHCSFGVEHLRGHWFSATRRECRRKRAAGAAGAAGAQCLAVPPGQAAAALRRRARRTSRATGMPLVYCQPGRRPGRAGVRRRVLRARCATAS